MQKFFLIQNSMNEKFNFQNLSEKQKFTIQKQNEILDRLLKKKQDENVPP